MIEKCVLTVLELINLEPVLGTWEDKIKHLLSDPICWRRPQNLISRRRKNENVFKMSEDKKMHVQSVQKCCFSLSNMQICGGFVAVVVVVA